MVLVKHEVPIGADFQHQGNSSHPGLIAGTQGPIPHPARAVLPQTAYETTFQIQVPTFKHPVSYGLHTRAGREDYQMQLALLEQQNIERLRAAKNRQSHAPALIGEAFTIQDSAMRKRILEEQNEKLPMTARPLGQESTQVSGASREDYHMQHLAVEQENQRRISGARQRYGYPNVSAQDEYQSQMMFQEEMSQKRQMFSKEGRAVREPTAHEHQDYQMQLMLLEQQNKKRLQAKQAEEARNSGFNDPYYYQQQLVALEQQNKRRLRQAMEQDDAKRQREASAPTPEQIQPLSEQDIQMQEQAVTEGRYPTVEDKWGKGPFPAGQGVISDYQIQLMALENRQKEEAAMRSQTEVEFAEQRRHYLSEASDMSSISGQRLPGTPGTSCTPPETPQSLDEMKGHTFSDRPLVFRPAPGPATDFDDLYD